MRYKEYASPRAWSLWLLLIFLLLLLPLCWLPQLSSEEASIALIAREMQDVGDLFTFKLFGQEGFTLPILPWTLAVMGKFMPIKEFTIRLLSIVPVGLLSIFCYWVVRRMTGLKTGPVAAAVAMSLAVIVFQKGVTGDGYMLYALFMNLAWFLFYYFGRIKRKWLLAWFLSHMFLSVALLTVGLKAVFLFYFPLMWLRRPMNIRRRMLTTEHAVSLLVTLLFLGGLIAMIPDLRNNLGDFFTTFGTTALRGSYFLRLLTFPVMAILGTFPWTFLGWPAFCQAFRPLEKDLVFASYSRTIVSSIFFLFWLIPSRGPSELLPLIGPFAILVAINYDVLVRRYGPELRRIVQVMAIVTLIITTAWVVGGFFQVRSGLAMLPNNIQQVAIFLSCSSVLLAALLIKWLPKFPIWFLMVLSVLMLKLMFAGTHFANRYPKVNKRRELAAKLAAPLPKDAVLYEVLPRTGYRDLPSEWFYLNHEVIKLGPDQKLPSAKEVYVIGGPHEPTIESHTVLPNEDAVPREWIPMTDEIYYVDDMTFSIWKGVRNEQVFAWRASDLKPNKGPVPYSKWVAEWDSPKGGRLIQLKKSAQPRWLSSRLYGKPTLRFEGGQYMYRSASDLQKHLELEHSFVLAVKLWRRNEKQVLLDIRGKGNESAVVLQRIEYDPVTRTIHSLSRDKDGNRVELQGKTDLSYASIIIIRRSKERMDLFVNETKLDSQVNTLTDIKGEHMRLYLGARGTDNAPDSFMYGVLPEFRILNRWLDDHRVHIISDSLLKTYFER